MCVSRVCGCGVEWNERCDEQRDVCGLMDGRRCRVEERSGEEVFRE